MSSVDIKDPDYVNWVKAVLVLEQLKDGLQDFLDREMRNVHADLLTRVRSQLPPNASLVCTTCTGQQLGKSKNRCLVCPKMVSEIKRKHKLEDPKWKNADVRIWSNPDDFWEVAKCFLPDGYTKKKTPADTDCTGLLSLVVNCKTLHPMMKTDLYNKSNLFTQVRTMRNTIMHASCPRLSGADLSQLVADSLAILQDPMSLEQEPAAKKAVANIAQIQEDVLEISMKDKLTILEEAKQTLHENELKQDLLEKYTTLSSVPVSRWNKKLKIEDIFTPIIIREDLEQKMLEASLQQPMSKVHLSGLVNERISSYDEVFTKDGMLQSDIYVIGKAGVGKSLFTLQLVNLWCKVQSSEPFTATEKLLKEFQYLFYVSCRYAKKPKESEEWDSLKDMAVKQNCQSKRYRDIANRILESSTRTCLILVDGLDEWGASASEQSTPVGRPGIPDRQDLDNCVILTTSRPWRIEALPEGVGRASRVLEIIGLDQDGVKELSENLLRALNVPDPRAAAESFLAKIKELKMEELVKVPLMLTNIVVTWHDSEHELSKSICCNYCGMMDSLIKWSVTTTGRVLAGTPRAHDSTEEICALPRCFGTREYCRQYWSLILKLAELAFGSLFAPEKEDSLVFSKKDLVSRIGEKELEESLKIGILSQSEAMPDSVSCMVTVSFIHKSVQEFLAALWLCGDDFETCFETFKNHCQTLENAFDFHLIIVFVCGLSPAQGSQLCQHILTVAERSDVVRQHRETEEYQFDQSRTFTPASLVVNLEELLLDCAREALEARQAELQNADADTDIRLQPNTPRHGGTAATGGVKKATGRILKLFKRSEDKTPKSRERIPETPESQIAQLFVIPDVFVDSKIPQDGRDLLYTQAKVNASSVKSLVFTAGTLTPDHMVFALQNMHQLERLHIASPAEQVDKLLRCICRIVQRFQGLKSFGLDVGSKPPPIVSHHYVKTVLDRLNSSKAHAALFIAGVELTDDDEGSGVKKGSSLLQSLKTKFRSSAAHPLSPNKVFPETLTSLASLDLRVLKIPHSSLQELCVCLKASTRLQRLALWDVRCRDCDGGSCQYTLDLSGMRQLHRLILGDVSVASVSVASEEIEEVTLFHLSAPGVHGPILSCLAQCPRLWKLEVVRILCQEDIAVLVNLLGKLTQLERLMVWEMDLSDLVIETSHMTRLKLLKLSDIKMTKTNWRQFLDSLPMNVPRVKLANCNFDGEIENEIRSCPYYKVLPGEEMVFQT